MIDNKEKTINNVVYVVTQFPARRALRLKTRLLKLVAPSLVAALGEAKDLNSIMGMNLNAKALKEAVAILMDRLEVAEVEDVIISLFASTRRDNKELTIAEFDTVFAGNFGEMYEALMFVLEVNFGSFLGHNHIGSQKLDQDKAV